MTKPTDYLTFTVDELVSRVNYSAADIIRGKLDEIRSNLRSQIEDMDNWEAKIAEVEGNLESKLNG